MGIHKGDLVEFTNGFHLDYTMGDPELANFGVATEAESNDRSVSVELANGVIKLLQSWQIMAYGWSGWMPEALEKVLEKYNPDDYDDDM